jgi:hypothetical protein
MNHQSDLPNREGDLQRTFKVRLSAAGVDTSAIEVEVRNSTAVLRGTITDVSVRQAIVEVLFGLSSLEYVVDSLCVGTKGASPQVYMKRGDSLTRAMEDLLHPEVSWEQYRAAMKRGRPT